MEQADKFEVAHLLYEEPPLNVFYLDHDPVAAARAHCDRHVVKMILETAQMLSTAWHELHNPMYRELDAPAEPYDAALGRTGLVPDPFYGTFNDKQYWLLCGQKIYSRTHAEHPSAQWARATAGNYRWLHALGVSLCAEYTYRYGRRHATEPVLWTLEIVPPGLEGEQTEPPPVMPEHCMVEVDGFWDSVQSYRTYYVEHKQPILAWTRRGHPSWLNEDPTGERGYVLA